MRKDTIEQASFAVLKHALSPTRKGHTYHYYVCSKKCGAPTADMEIIHAIAKDYLSELLSPANMRLIASAVLKYQNGMKSRADEFNRDIKQQIKQKEVEYENLVKNLSSGVLPPDVVTDLGNRMQRIKEEIDALETTPPPTDFTSEQIVQWLNAITASPDAKAIQILIERIDVQNKTDITVTSTLMSVLGKDGRGDRI